MLAVSGSSGSDTSRALDLVEDRNASPLKQGQELWSGASAEGGGKKAIGG